MTQLAVMCVPSIVPMASSTYVHLFASLRPISSGSLPPLLFFPIPPIKAAPLPLLPALLVSLLALNGATRNMGVGRARLPSPAGRSPLPLWALHCVREKNSQYAHGHQVCINVTYRRIKLSYSDYYFCERCSNFTACRQNKVLAHRVSHAQFRRGCCK
jgi:hypothetical protein